MLFRTCKSLDSVSQYFSEPQVLLSVVLNKDKKFIKVLNTLAKELPKIILDIVKASPESSLVHIRLSMNSKVIRVFAVKDTVVASLKEDELGHVLEFGVSTLDEFAKILEKDVQVGLLVEEIPLKSLDQTLANLVHKCVEESEKPHILMWKTKGLYGFKLEELISDKGGYTYVFKAVNINGELCALKVFKEEVVVNRDFMDLLRGYIQSVTVNSLGEEEFKEFVKGSGYSLDTLKDLYKYKKYIALVKALIIGKDKLDKNTYLLNPPAIVEEYASLGDLETYVQRNGARGLEEALYMVLRVLGATALAHLIEVPHLDIKPRNILLFEDPQEKFNYSPKLTDFSGALGSSVRGFKIVRLTPGYADPIALAKGVADFSYDVYSIAMVLAYTLTGDIPRHRLILNILLLQNIYGYPIPMEKIRNEEKPLKEFSKKILDIVLQLKGKAISWNDFAQKVHDELEPLDPIYMPWINEVPKSIANVFKKALALRSDIRYRNCIDMWIDLKDALIKESMEKML